jgi:hypothetical protein
MSDSSVLLVLLLAFNVAVGGFIFEAFKLLRRSRR